MNPPMLAYFIPSDRLRKVEACVLAPHPISGQEDEVSYLPSMYSRMRCRIVERLACQPVADSCLWVDEEALCRSEPPPINLRASILAAREVYGDCILAGDDGMRTINCKVNMPAKFFGMLDILATTVAATMANGIKEGSE